VAFAEYHCSICNLWMSKEDHPFHCNYCGFCRLRGKSKASYQHCSHCNMCILEHVIHDHNCQKDKYKTNCPICFEDLFSSRTAIHEMNCGHSIHWHCFQTLNHNTLDTAADYSSRCPLCKKTADSHELMRPTWNAIATAIQIQPIPPEYAQVVTIFCNDCNVKCTCRPWHFLGVQCTECRSFNTSIIETVFTGEAAVEYLRRSDEQTNGST
jgi:RING finger/CHY zinc finger protein 1